LWLAGGGDAIALISLVTFIIVIPSAPWHPEMQFAMHTVVFNQGGLVSASNLRLLKHHFGDQIIKKNRIVKMHFIHSDDHGRCLVLRQLDLMLCGSKSDLSTLCW
jgi:hypothetical protein